jgi:hypothetical protein
MSYDGIDSVGKRGVFTCRIASLFVLQRLKGSMSGDVRDFINIKRRALIKPPHPARQGKALKEIHSIMTEILGEHSPTIMPPSKTGWPSLTFRNRVFYVECNRRNGPNFRRVFLILNYTDITQNTYVQSFTVPEIMAIEKCGLLWGRRTASHL